MPPAAIRRPITVTVWLVMSIVCLALSPVLLALAALASAVTGRPQALIFARLVVAYFALELATLIACGALWLASCGGLLMGTQPFQRLHYRLLRWSGSSTALPAAGWRCLTSTSPRRSPPKQLAPWSPTGRCCFSAGMPVRGTPSS